MNAFSLMRCVQTGLKPLIARRRLFMKEVHQPPTAAHRLPMMYDQH
jgi:hypothetical protein